MINTLLFPLMRKYRKLIISMIAVSSLGIALMVGLSGAYHTLELSLNAYVQDYRYADAVMLSEETEKQMTKALLEIPGVKQVNGRWIADSVARLPSGRLTAIRGISYGIRDFQQFYVWDMLESSEYPNILLDFMFAERNGIHVGDLIEVRLEDKYETVCVGSIISSAECLSIQADAFSMDNNPDFGYMFVPEELLFESDYYTKCNQFLLRFDTWAKSDEIMAQAEELLGDAFISSFSYQDSGVNRRIEFNLQPLEKLSILLPILFFLTMIAVVSLFISQIIRQSRRDIGILRALGFGKQRVRLLFSAMMLAVTLIASAIGLGVGIGLMFLTSRIYGNFFPLPKLYYSLSPAVCALAAIITVAAGQVSVSFGTTIIARILPSEAMSREIPTASKTPAFLQKILSRLSPRIKFCITSIFRNRKRFVFSVFCVASSVTLILSAIAFNESKNGMLSTLFDGRVHYSCQIFFSEDPSTEALAEIAAVPGVSGCQRLDYYRMELCANGKSDTCLLASVSPDTDAVTVFGLEENPIAIPETGLILERHTADALGVRVGDTVTADGIALTVAALSDQPLNRISYLSTAQAQALGEADRATVICNAEQENLLLDQLSQIDGFSHADFTRLLRQTLEQTFATYSIGVEILISFAVMLGIIIVYNTMQTNLLEQKKELSVLRAVGFQISDISAIWLLQSGLQFVLASLIGLPVGVAVAKYVLKQMETSGREYIFPRSPVQYFITLGLVAGYILLSHFSAMRIIRSWDISENTKEKE